MWKEKSAKTVLKFNGTGNLKPLNLDAKNIPDLVPDCATLACFAKGTTQITGAQRLKLKESDRLSSIHSELKKMGAQSNLRARWLNY